MPTWNYEDLALKEANDTISNQSGLICGIDEVGRGCLAGPVVACAAVFKQRNVDFLLDINDSKKLNKIQRERLYVKLQKNTFYAIGICSHLEIDEINIFQASLLAMKRAYEKLSNICQPRAVLIDGNKTINTPVKNYAVVKGDSKSYSIAAASILAKVYRDNLMKQLSKENNNHCYNWEKNAGYATKEHKLAIQMYGISQYHRKSFSPIKKMLT